MKKLTSLNGLKTLSKNEQKSINGGVIKSCTGFVCLWRCVNGKCVGPDVIYM